jgi:hypothetical protein
MRWREVSQRQILGDGEVLAVAAAIEELQRRLPVVGEFPVGPVLDVAMAVEGPVDELQLRHRGATMQRGHELLPFIQSAAIRRAFGKLTFETRQHIAPLRERVQVGGMQLACPEDSNLRDAGPCRIRSAEQRDERRSNKSKCNESKS